MSSGISQQMCLDYKKARILVCYRFCDVQKPPRYDESDRRYMRRKGSVFFLFYSIFFLLLFFSSSSSSFIFWLMPPSPSNSPIVRSFGFLSLGQGKVCCLWTEKNVLKDRHASVNGSAKVNVGLYGK